MKSYICFILLNFRQANLVLQRVQELRRFYPEASFVVVDNDSRDGSYKRIEDVFEGDKKVEVVRNISNLGYAVGNNLGVREAIKMFDPEFVAIMNPDVVIFDERIVPSIIDAFSKDKNLAICTGLMLNSCRMLNPKSIAWKIPDKLDDCLLNLPFFSSRFGVSKYKLYRVEENGIIYVEVVPGSFFVAKTEYFTKMGMFDENTFLYCEERILGWKAKKHGFKIALVPGFFFLHDHPKKRNPFSTMMRSYYRLIKSRFYYNKVYNSLPRWFVLPLFSLSAVVGFLLKALMWVIRK